MRRSGVTRAAAVPSPRHWLWVGQPLRATMFWMAGVLNRADPRDRLIGAESLEALPPGALVGTSSPRRTAQLLARRPDLRTVPIRGNVQTRLAKVARGDV